MTAQVVEAPNNTGSIRITGSGNRYTLETSFFPFGQVRFMEELERRVHVTEVRRTTKGGTYKVIIENNPEKLTIAELVTEAVEESKVFENG